MEIPERNGAAELPASLQWLCGVKGISVPDGIRNTGGISQFTATLKQFYDTAEDSMETLTKALDTGNLRLYTIKLQVLGTSAHLIGASALSALASRLREAGERQDTDFIAANTGQLLRDCQTLRDALSRIKEEGKA